MEISANWAPVSVARAIGQVAATVALAVTLALAASPGAAFARRHHQNKNSFSGNGTADSIAIAAATLSNCTTSISACCKIASGSGLYTVTGAITGNQGSGTCISIINPNNVILNLNGNTITQDASSTGTGTGIGIVGTGNGNYNGRTTQAYVEGLNGSVNGFGTGVFVNANAGYYGNDPAVTVEAVNVASNGTGFYGTGANVSFSNVAATSNTYGVEIATCQNCYLNFGDIESNTNFGVWLFGASGSAVNSVFATNNGIAGVYAGCNDGSTTKIGTSCSNGVTGSGNQIFNGIIETNPNATSGYGIYVDNGETSDAAGNNSASGNLYDGFDDNSGCGSNSWFGNVFTAVSPSCVH